MCGISIASMAIDFAFALFESITFVLSFGTSSSLSSSFKAMKDAFKSLSK